MSKIFWHLEIWEEAAAEEAAELDAFETGMADIVESESEISSDSDSD